MANMTPGVAEGSDEKVTTVIADDLGNYRHSQV